MARTKGQRGLAALEFGLIAPLVMILLFGVVEFGLALWRKQILTSAVREGARKGVVATTPRKTQAEIETAVKTYLTGVGWDSTKAVVNATGAGGAAGTSLTVTATYPTSLLVISRLMPGTFTVNNAGNVTLTATVVMQME
jgi:Flp pilus assembly protein TadG